MKKALAAAGALLLELLALGIIGILIVLTIASPGGETAPMKQKPTLGRVVLYSFIDSARGNAIVERPAEVVSCQSPDHINLRVTLDGTNDLGLAGVTAEDCKRLSFWATSIAVGDDPAVPQAGRWRWPPRE